MSTIVKPSPISGFPEWLPYQKKHESEYIRQISLIFESFGFVPLETSAIERNEVLSSKGEINKQIYSLSRPNADKEEDKDTGLSLHFDLTVPLARYVAQNYNNLAFPFKRYQIQKVWRGERAQKGRFREFYQCDIDIIGNSELDIYADAEVASIIYKIFKKLSFGDFRIHISNRKILSGIIESFNINEEESANFFTALDKAERSADGMAALKNLLSENISKEDKIISFLDFMLTERVGNKEVIQRLQEIYFPSEKYTLGVRELLDVYNNLILLGCKDADIKIDISIVRGLDYYTGTVFETFLIGHEKTLGSICSGGRFDDLASYFTDKKLPGVGISIGLTRLLSYIFDNNLIDNKEISTSKIMIAMMDRKYLEQYIKWMSYFQLKGINAEIYIASDSLKKQLSYADKKGIRYVLIYGEDEEGKKIVKLKDMNNKESRNEQTIAYTENTEGLIVGNIER